MKKVYSQPNILFERFSLCTSVAAGCEKVNSTFSKGVCGFRYDTFTIFTSDVQGCKVDGAIAILDGSINGICYHNPSDLNNVFNS